MEFLSHSNDRTAACHLSPFGLIFPGVLGTGVGWWVLRRQQEERPL